MHKNPFCTIELIFDDRQTNRGLGFLIFASNKKVTAKGHFDRLNKKLQNKMRVSFDYWKIGTPGSAHQKKHFHGYEQTHRGGQFQQCFTFKTGRAPWHRLHGFFEHPLAPENRRYQFCLLVTSDAKTDYELNVQSLTDCIEFKSDKHVATAISLLFERTEGGKR